MTTVQAKQLSESALNRLMAALEQGHSAALKHYLVVMLWRAEEVTHLCFPQSTRWSRGARADPTLANGILRGKGG